MAKKITKTLREYIHYCNILEEEYIKKHNEVRELNKLLKVNNHPKLQKLKNIFDEINDIPDITKEGRKNNLENKKKIQKDIMRKAEGYEKIKKKYNNNKKSKKQKFTNRNQNQTYN